MYKMFYTGSQELVGELAAAKMKEDAKIIVNREVYYQHVRVENRKAYLAVTGAIVPDITYWGSTSLESLRALIDHAIDDDEVDEIILGFNSGGGYTAGVEETANHIKRAAEQKKITAFVFGSCASAAYWLASACSEIVVNSTAEVGSIGAVIAVWNWGTENIIEFVSKFSQNKRPDVKTEDGKAEYQKRVDALGEIFLTAVAENRGMTPEQIIKAGDSGGMIHGSLAVTRGLADRVGSLHDLMNPAIETSETEEIIMDIAELKQKHPAVYAEACADGIGKENKRVLEIKSLAMPGNEAIIEAAIADPKKTAADVSLDIIRSQKEAAEKARTALREGSVPPVAGAEQSPGDQPVKSKLETLTDKVVGEFMTGGTK